MITPFFSMSPEWKTRLYQYLLTQRELNLDTLKSTIQVDCDYSEYVEYLAKELGMKEPDCFECLQALEAHEDIFIMPGTDSHIDYIEID